MQNIHESLKKKKNNRTHAAVDLSFRRDVYLQVILYPACKRNVVGNMPIPYAFTTDVMPGRFEIPIAGRLNERTNVSGNDIRVERYLFIYLFFLNLLISATDLTCVHDLVYIYIHAYMDVGEGIFLFY